MSSIPRDTTSDSIRLLVAIPCLNEADTIAKVIRGIPSSLPGVSHTDALVIDDGSTDTTAAEAARAGARVIRHPVNRGVGVAFQAAINFAVSEKYDVMVNIDGDGQFDSADISKLVSPILNGQADMTTASRFIDAELIPDMPRAKLIGNKLMSLLISRLVRKKFYDVSCGFRCYSREALLRLNLHGAFTYTQETFLDFAAKNVRISEIPVKVQYFPGRQSRVAGSLPKYAAKTLQIISRGYRDYFPLRFFWTISAIFAVPGVVLAALFFGHAMKTGMFSGYLFAGFGAAFSFLMATIFFVVGIVADMLDRIRSNQERILYLLKKGD